MNKLLIDRDNIILHPRGGSHIHPATEFSTKDMTAALILLDTLGYDILIFGWLEVDNGFIRVSDIGYKE